MVYKIGGYIITYAQARKLAPKMPLNGGLLAYGTFVQMLINTKLMYIVEPVQEPKRQQTPNQKKNHDPPTVHSYDACDVGTFPNQTDKDQLGPPTALHSDASRAKYNFELSWLSEQKLSCVRPLEH